MLKVTLQFQMYTQRHQLSSHPMIKERQLFAQEGKIVLSTLDVLSKTHQLKIFSKCFSFTGLVGLLALFVCINVCSILITMLRQTCMHTFPYTHIHKVCIIINPSDCMFLFREWTKLSILMMKIN